MAKMTEEERIKDQFERLQRAADSARGKIGKNNASTKADGPEKEYSDAYYAMVMFGRKHGLCNLVPLKRKYRRR